MGEVASASCRLPRAGGTRRRGTHLRGRGQAAGLACLSTGEGFSHPLPEQPLGALAPPAQPHRVLPALLGWSFPLPYAQHRQTVSPCLLA